MPAFCLLTLQFGLAPGVATLIAPWWVVPRLARLQKPRALLALLVINAFRWRWHRQPAFGTPAM